MITKIKYASMNANVYIQALDCIPLIRDGKADINALTSFHQDIKFLKKFIQAYQLAEDKKEQLEIIDKWNKFIELRNIEDFICHSDSKNKSFYFITF